MNKSWIVLISLLMSFGGATQSLAALHYVTPTGAGSRNGSNWSNAYQGIPAVLTRGDTYYLAGGSYAGRTLNTTASGAAMITLQGATVSDHGTDTGWSDTYSVETNQAHFTSPFSIMTSSWTLDGAVGSLTPTASAYGFQFDQFSCSGPQNAIQFGNWTTGPLDNFMIRHIAFLACAGDIEKSAIGPHSQSDNLSDITVAHCLFDGWQGAVTSGKDTAPVNRNYTIEYNYFVHHFSSSSHHGEWLNNNASTENWIVRFNRFMDATGTACMAANNADILSAFVYGNIFANCSSGNGILSGTSAGRLSNTMVYNNTFVACGGGPWLNSGQLGGTGNMAYNNLLYNMNAALGSGVSAHDYNAYISCTNVPAETNRQTGSGNPFINSAAGDFHLAATTQPGTPFASPYDVDPDGVTRGGDGTWDRGAFEFSQTHIPLPIAGLSRLAGPLGPALLRVYNIQGRLFTSGRDLNSGIYLKVEDKDAAVKKAIMLKGGRP